MTASFLGATATFEVQVEDLVTEQYTGSYELVQGETPTRNGMPCCWWITPTRSAR